MQAHLHLCFLTRSCLAQVGWKLVAWGVFLAFITSIVALTPQAIIAWGSQAHQVSICEGVVVLHHPNQGDRINDDVPTLRNKFPSLPDHVFDLANESLCSEICSDESTPSPEKPSDLDDVNPFVVWQDKPFASTRLIPNGRRHYDSLLEQWSTVCLLI